MHRFMKQIARFFLCVILTASLFAQGDDKWVSCSGEAAVQNITNEEAQVLALRRARLDAIEKVCGVSLKSESLVKDFRMVSDFVHAISYGHIVEEKDIRWETETLPPETPAAPPVILVRVRMLAVVIPEQGKSDPAFKVDLKLNRTVFQAGDEVILQVKPTKDCYITVVNLAANDSVYMLFPNQFQLDNLVSANRTIGIPTREAREKGLHIHVAPLAGHKKDTELVRVIATRQKIHLLEEADVSGGFGSIGTPKLAVTKLARLISEIPMSERAEAMASYTVQTAD